MISPLSHTIMDPGKVAYLGLQAFEIEPIVNPCTKELWLWSWCLVCKLTQMYTLSPSL